VSSFPRRAAATFAGTVIGLGLLLEAKTGAGAPRSALAPGFGTTSLATAPPAPDPATTGAAPSTRTTTATTAPASATRAIDGPAVDVRYGTVQVAVTLQGNRITDVTALQLPSDRARSRAISQYAAPTLRSEALQAQSAQIDTVSGASYTSDGYAQSLQGALDQAARG
jgi:uncharacterized protein with FMN-binding domain